jgi:hypothetical protein
MAMDNNKIINFWKWFENNQDNLVPEKINNTGITNLNNKILELGDFAWEIREGLNKDNMLIISPGGDVGLLNATQNIISFGPELPNWEYYHYKPAKNWDFKLSILEKSNIKKILDVSEWYYVLYRFSDNTYDIIIKASNLNNTLDEEKLIIADIVLESIFGEELSLKLFKNIEFVNEFNEEDISKVSSIQNLQKHLETLETSRI